MDRQIHLTVRHSSTRSAFAVVTALALGALALLASGCGTSTSLPEEPPSIIGTVSNLSVAPDKTAAFLIDDGDADVGYDKAYVTVTADTTIVNADGEAGSTADLANGRRVEVWFTGAVAESYPVQATAGHVRIAP